MAAGIFDPRCRTNAGKCLVAEQRDGFIFGGISALYHEADRPYSIRLFHVERQKTTWVPVMALTVMNPETRLRIDLPWPYFAGRFRLRFTAFLICFLIVK